MPDTTIHAVTGAYGYSGKYIAQRLLAEGQKVITLTNSLSRANPFGDRIRALPFHFREPDLLAENLNGVSVLYNTYWVRFNHRLFKHADAVRNTLALFEAARRAGVQRIVHVSITNPSEASTLEYFRGKAILEKALIESGISHAILRPAVLFGKEDILINNIAWVLRRLPVFGVFGNGRYRVQPIYVDDLAALAVEQGHNRENVIVNAIGPETFTFRELVARIARLIGIQRPIVSVPPSLGYTVGWLLGKFVGDVVITKDEIEGLMADLLYVDAPPAGQTILTEWVKSHADTLGGVTPANWHAGRTKRRPIGRTEGRTNSMTTLQIGRYRHYKGKQYTVIGVARHSETEEELVVYRKEYDDHGLWVRPKDMFLERVEVSGQTVPRFEYLGPQ